MLEGVGAVDFRRLVLVFVGVGEDARCEQHGGRDADPGIDHESDEARGPGGIRAEEKDRIPSALRDIVVDGAAVCEHELKAEHRDEPGDRIGEDGEKPPEHLSFDAGLIEKERERQPAEIVDARREHRPEDVPAEDLEEGRRIFAHRHELAEVFKAHPVDEAGRHDVAAVVGEGDEDHEDDGKDTEHADAQHG